jgi:hypothetical protein
MRSTRSRTRSGSGKQQNVHNGKPELIDGFGYNDGNGGVFFQKDDGWHSIAYQWLDVTEGDEYGDPEHPYFVAEYAFDDDVKSFDNAIDSLNEVTDHNIVNEIGWYATEDEAKAACIKNSEGMVG